MNKLQKIDKILEDKNFLENYISEIEDKQIKVPSNLEQKILSKINKKRKIYYEDICKIVACLIFSLAICRTDFIKNDELSNYEFDKPKASISINEKISDFCKWFTTPLEIEKGENNEKE